MWSVPGSMPPLERTSIKVVAQEASGAHTFNRLHCSADDSGGSKSSSGGHSGSTVPRSALYEDSSCTFCRSPLKHMFAMEVSGSPLSPSWARLNRECQSVRACGGLLWLVTEGEKAARTLDLSMVRTDSSDGCSKKARKWSTLFKASIIWKA